MYKIFLLFENKILSEIFEQNRMLRNIFLINAN